ncbi:MAG: hypothetical protein WAK84_06215 [Candidatus Cybelea sp.]
MEADVNDTATGGLIDDFYTDFTITDDDQACLERFLSSSDLGTRREALIALMFGVNKETGPKFTGYAVDAGAPIATVAGGLDVSRQTLWRALRRQHDLEVARKHGLYRTRNLKG